MMPPGLLQPGFLQPGQHPGGAQLAAEQGAAFPHPADYQRAALQGGYGEERYGDQSYGDTPSYADPRGFGPAPGYSGGQPYQDYNSPDYGSKDYGSPDYTGRQDYGSQPIWRGGDPSIERDFPADQSGPHQSHQAGRSPAAQHQPGGHASAGPGAQHNPGQRNPGSHNPESRNPGQHGQGPLSQGRHSSGQHAPAPHLTGPIPVIPGATAPRPSARLNPKYTFETFVIGSSNRFAHAAAVAVAEAPAKAYNPLFIYGDSGLGKTHLLHAIGHYAQTLYAGLRVRYVQPRRSSRTSSST